MPNQNNQKQNQVFFSIFFLLYFSQTIFLMGQTACCTPDSDLNNTFNPNPLNTRTTAGQKYTPVTKLTKLNQYVEETKKLLGQYKFRKKQHLKNPGQKRGPHLINQSNVIYVGQWKNQQPHGVGQLYFPDGSYYFGTFQNGYAQGQGRFIFQGGSFYQGQVRHNVAQGKGALVNDVQQYKYVGNWLNDLPNGKGQQFWGDGTHYKGDYLNGQKHGKGQYKFTDQTNYQGFFKHDKFDGQGMLTIPEGKYKGQFLEGKFHGKGLFKWKDGSTYEGDYQNDKKNGFGRYIDKDGKTFQGYWKDGIRHGQGTVTNQTGQVFKGRWINGQFY